MVDVFAEFLYFFLVLAPTNGNNLKGCTTYFKIIFFLYFSPHFFFLRCDFFFTFALASFCNILCLYLVKIHCTISLSVGPSTNNTLVANNNVLIPQMTESSIWRVWSICKPEVTDKSPTVVTRCCVLCFFSLCSPPSWKWIPAYAEILPVRRILIFVTIWHLKDY